jgi:hypothetical protein
MNVSKKQWKILGGKRKLLVGTRFQNADKDKEMFPQSFLLKKIHRKKKQLWLERLFKMLTRTRVDFWTRMRKETRFI